MVESVLKPKQEDKKMARIARLKKNGEPTCYHAISRTALPGLPFEDVENDELLKTVKRFHQLYFTDIFRC